MKKRKFTLVIIFVLLSIVSIQSAFSAAGLENIAIGKTIVGSSDFSVDFPVTNVNDGNLTTLWGTKYSTANEWVYIDLGKLTAIQGIALRWYDVYYASNYQVALSNDFKTWNFVYENKAGKGGDEELIAGGTVDCRYIGILFKAGPNNIYALKEFEVLAPSPSTPTPTSTVVITPTPTATVTPTPTMTPQYPAWAVGTSYAIGDKVSHNGMVFECLLPHSALDIWAPNLTPDLWKYIEGGTPVTFYPADGSLQDVHAAFIIMNEDETSFTGVLEIKNPNTEYVWNGTYFCLDWIDTLTFEMTSQITEAKLAGNKITPVIEGNLVKFSWREPLFAYGQKAHINIKATKSGAIPLPQNIKPNLLRGDIIYPEYEALPATWYKNKPDLSAADLIADATDYYNPTVGPVEDKLIIYNPPHKTQLIICQTYRVDTVINGVENAVRIWIPSKYLGMGLGFNLEQFKINPNYMLALGTKENFAAGVVPEGVGVPQNPVVIDGETWYWWMQAHVDGPFQQEETGNFQGCKWYFPDFLAADASHDNYTAITVDPNDLNWMSATISSGVSLTRSRETICAIYRGKIANTAVYHDFLNECVDPWAEMAALTYTYNRGYKDFLGKKFFEEPTKTMPDVIQGLGILGFANHVPIVKTITDTLNKDTTDRYDAQITWDDMEKFFPKLRMFYPHAPSDAEWTAMINDTHKAFDILKQHWGGEYISLRYDYLTLMRVIRKYLPTPYHPRPTSEYWYWAIHNSAP